MSESVFADRIVQNLLDTDFYKLTMMQAVLHNYPNAEVEWEFRCRNGEDLRPYLAEIRYQIERLAELCQHHNITLLQPSSYRVFDGSRATAYSEKDEPVPLGLRGQALWRIEQSVRATCPQHVLLRFGWVLDDSVDGVLGRFLTRAEHSQELLLADDRRARAAASPSFTLWRMMLRSNSTSDEPMT